ncbi:MAG TPA: AAA family ATPase [Pseudonocardiaceae bacterium]|nr:AAA family ATPase [Pseudonocardiaceae bacterium]
MTGRQEQPQARWFPPGGDAGPPAQDALPGWQPPPQSAPREPHPSGPHQVDLPPDRRAGPDHPVPPDYGNHQQPEYGQAGPQPHHADRSGPHRVDQTSSGRYLVGVSQQPPAPGAQPGQNQPQPQNQPHSQPHSQPQPAQQTRHSAVNHDLSSAQLLRQQAKRPPQTGWRRAVYVATGHAVNLGESPDDRRHRELIHRINQPLEGCYKIAMLSLKGGVGKTTTTAALGSTFASLRGDRVIAVDANPDRGTLSQKIPLETTATVRHLLRDAARIRRYSDVRAYTSQGASRLEVLASEQDPAVSEAFSERDYRRTVNLLEHFYNIVLTDCGTGLMHSAMKGVLELADSLVVVSSGSIDGARSASATLDWLDAHGYRLLVARSVAVINSVRPKAGKVDLNKVADHFAARCRAVCRIPFDPHLEEGAELEVDQLTEATRLALLELAATVADDFPHAANRARPR